MSLLQIISKAQPDGDSRYPIVLNPDPVFGSLKPLDEDADDTILVKRVSGFEIAPVDSERIELGQKFVKKLRRSLKNANGFGKDEFVGMLNSFLDKNGEKSGVTMGGSEKGSTAKLVQKMGFLMGRDARGLVLEACVVLEIWDVLEALIVNGLVEFSCISKLVNNLIEKSRSDLIVLCVKHLSDIQTSDFLCILKYFLCPSKEGYENMISVRKEWESQALLAIDESLHGKKMNVAKDAALLLMVAHDGFSVAELCLHYLLALKDVDEMMLGSCISKLNGSEMMSLIRYLNKWLKKYERFPQVTPCPKASSILGLKVCEWIPTLEDVVKCLGLVVDEHFSSLLLHPEFHEELRSLEGLVGSLAEEARLCGSVANLVESLRSDDRAAQANYTDGGSSLRRFKNLGA